MVLCPATATLVVGRVLFFCGFFVLVFFVIFLFASCYVLVLSMFAKLLRLCFLPNFLCLRVVCVLKLIVFVSVTGLCGVFCVFALRVCLSVVFDFGTVDIIHLSFCFSPIFLILFSFSF